MPPKSPTNSLAPKFLPMAMLALVAMSSNVMATEDKVSNINVTETDGTIESGWLVQIPSGPSDFFHVLFDLDSAMAPAERNGILKGMVGAPSDSPRIGFYAPNPGGSPIGNPVVEVFSPTVDGTGYADLPDVDLSTLADGTYLLAIQFNPGGSLFGVGGDDNGTGGGGGVSNPIDRSFWTADGYTTPANPAPSEWYLNLVIDPKNSEGAQLRAHVSSSLTGDWNQVHASGGEFLGLSFFGQNPTGDLWALFMATGPGGVPVPGLPPLTPVFATVPDPAGDYARIAGTWPDVFGGATFHFIAAWGNPSLGGSGLTNTITISN